MANKTPAYSGGFPDELANPQGKEKKDWCLAYAKAVLREYDALPSEAIGWKSRERYKTIKKYALARQDTGQYTNLLSPGPDPSENMVNGLVVDFTKRIPVIPKFRRIGIGLLEKVDYDTVISTIDPLAATEVEKKINEARTKAVLRNALIMAGLPQMASAPAVAQQAGEPDDLDGIEVMQLGIRHEICMDCEEVVAKVFNQNNYESIRREYLADLFDFGVGAIKDDTSGCDLSIRKVDVRRLVLSPCIYPDFKDVRYVGEIVDLTVAQLIEQSDGQIKQEDIQIIYNNAMNGTKGGVIIPSGVNDFGEFCSRGKVQVLDLEMLSQDTIAREERTNKRGNKVFGKTKPEAAEKNENVKTKKVQSVYRIKHVIGTDFCFDYGRQFNIKRDSKNVARAQLSYHIATAEFDDMVSFSRTEALIPFADAIQLAHYKITHTLNSAIPKGYEINLDMLEDISLKGGDEFMSPADVLDLFFKRGILVSRSKDIGGNGKGGDRQAIRDLVGGIGSEVAEYWTVINNNTQMAQQTLGFNELTDGSTPNPKLLIPVANLAASGTNNALSDLFFADRALTKSITGSIIIRAQDMMRNGIGDDFISALGAGTGKLMAEMPPIDKYRFGLTIESRPTAAEEQAFQVSVDQALGAQQIGIDDVVRMRNIPNLKQREKFLVYRVKKRAEETQARAQQDMQANAQVQQQSAQVAEKAKQDTLVFEYKLKSLLSQQEHSQLMKQGKQQLYGKQETERISSTGRIEASTVQALAKDADSIRNATTKLVTGGSSDAIGLIDIPASLKSNVDPLTSATNPELEPVEDIDDQPFDFLAGLAQITGEQQAGPQDQIAA